MNHHASPLLLWAESWPRAHWPDYLHLYMDVFGLALASLSLTVSIATEMPEAQRRELLQGCSTVLAPEVCSDEPQHVPQAWVELLGEGRVSLQVELREPHAQGSATRELTFSPSDDPLNRARAAGLSLGLMTKALRSRPSELPTPKQPEPPPLEPPAREPSLPVSGTEVQAEPHLQRKQAGSTKPSRRRPTFEPTEDAKREEGVDAKTSLRRPLSLGLEAGAFFDPLISSVEGGGVARFETRPFRIVGFFVGADLRAGPAADGALSVRRISPTAGLLFSARLPALEVVPMLEGGAQALRLELTGEDSADLRWFATIRLGLSLRFPARSRLQFTVTPRLTWNPSQTVIKVENVSVYKTAPLNPSIDLGISWAPQL